MSEGNTFSDAWERVEQAQDDLTTAITNLSKIIDSTGCQS